MRARARARPNHGVVKNRWGLVELALLCPPVIDRALDDPRFQLTRTGRFRERFGPAWPGARESRQKVCFVATDAAFLIDLLYGLSLRPDCGYVKYGMLLRDGMVLGRCSMATDRAAAELCASLKGHPRLMVTLQDDDTLNPFRQDGDAVGVWDELDEDDIAAVERVNLAAFGQPDEANMVRAARATRVGIVSLVLGLTPEAGDHTWSVVGHVMLSPVTLDGRAEPRGLGLAPLSVLPEQQRKGFGSRLVNAAIERARLLGTAYLVVLGHPAYYQRFGFVPASRFGLRSAFDAPEDAFMAQELVPGALHGVRGVVRYLDAFS